MTIQLSAFCWDGTHEKVLHDCPYLPNLAYCWDGENWLLPWIDPLYGPLAAMMLFYLSIVGERVDISIYTHTEQRARFILNTVEVEIESSVSFCSIYPYAWTLCRLYHFVRSIISLPWIFSASSASVDHSLHSLRLVFRSTVQLYHTTSFLSVGILWQSVFGTFQPSSILFYDVA